MKETLQEQSGSKATHLGISIDVKGPHRLVAIRHVDWPLIACQLEPGGAVCLNKRDTFGIRLVLEAPPTGRCSKNGVAGDDPTLAIVGPFVCR